MEVREYRPLEKHDLTLENQLRSVSQEWLLAKNSDEMIFMLGGDGLDDPLDRRYFYCVDSEGILQGFVVFLPYMQKKVILQM